MASTDIFNFKEQLTKHMTDSTKESLTELSEAFENGHFLDVTTHIHTFREAFEVDDSLNHLLLLLEATACAQANNPERAKHIIHTLYNNDDKKSIDDLLLYGNLAFMADLKLARRIMTDAVKQLESAEAVDVAKAGQAYLVLGETEEHLRNLVRAARYYEKALDYATRDEENRESLILFIHFKLGAIFSLRNETDEALNYFEQAIERAGDDNEEIKINCMLSIAKIYNRLEQYEDAHRYLDELLPLVEKSSLNDSFVHAEALTDLAYNYFCRKMYEEAAEAYERATDMHELLPNLSVRELGMIYMQFAYCLEQKDDEDNDFAASTYNKAYDNLKLANDNELLVDAMNDIVRFADETNKHKMKKTYENRLMKLMKEMNNS